jgi:hypothetical protein
MPTRDPRLSTLGFLWLVFAIVCIAHVIWIVMYRATLKLMWGAVITRVADPYAWMGYFNVVILLLIVLLCVTALFSLVAGLSLMSRTSSSRALPSVAAILGLLTGPLGIALGAYTLVLVVPRAPAHEQPAL